MIAWFRRDATQSTSPMAVQPQFYNTIAVTDFGHPTGAYRSGSTSGTVLRATPVSFAMISQQQKPAAAEAAARYNLPETCVPSGLVQHPQNNQQRQKRQQENTCSCMVTPTPTEHMCV